MKGDGFELACWQFSLEESWLLGHSMHALVVPPVSHARLQRPSTCVKRGVTPTVTVSPSAFTHTWLAVYNSPAHTARS